MYAPDFAAVRSHLRMLSGHTAQGTCPCHVHGTDLLPDLYEILRLAQMQQTGDDLARLLVSAFDVLRYYRTRVHRATEDETGTFGPLNTVYGIHREAMHKADELLVRARQLGFTDTEEVPS